MASRARAASGRRSATSEDEMAAQQERINSLQQEKQQLLEDNHSGHKEALAKLQAERSKKEAVADRAKQQRVDYITFIYEAERQQIEDEYQDDLRRHKEILLGEIRKKVRELDNSSDKGRKDKRRKIDGTGDSMKSVLVKVQETLMNLDYVISDDDIRADINLIYKNLDKLTKGARKSNKSS